MTPLLYLLAYPVLPALAVGLVAAGALGIACEVKR